MSRVPARKRFGISTIIGGALFALLLIVSLFSTGIGGLLVMAGLVAFVTGIYVVVTRRPSWLGSPRCGVWARLWPPVASWCSWSARPHTAR